MNSIVEFFQHPGFEKILVNSFPCSLIVLDDRGRVQTANRLVERTLGISKEAITGKSIGEALGCIDAAKIPGKCGPSEFCSGCEVRNLCLAATHSNQVQKGRTYLQIMNNGQVRDADLVSVPSQ